MAYIGNPAAPTLAQVSDNTITSAKIVDGAVTPSDLSTGHPNWDSSGNVGIGTSSPGQKLDVSGGSVQIGNNVSYRVKDTAGNSIRAVIMGSDNVLYSGCFDSPTSGGSYALMANGSERMRIDSSGNVGIGTSSPAAKLQAVIGSGASVGVKYLNAGGSGLQFYTDSTASNADTFIESPLTGVAMIFKNGGSERMRIASDGKVLINTTSASGSESKIAAWTTNSGCYEANGTTDYYPFAVFRSGTLRGSIYQSGTSTAYNTSSDYRLKENIAPMTGALATVAQLKPCTYTWKEDGSAGQGFIAHELQEVVPDCVTGAKDAVDADGKIIPQGVDTSFLVATLTAAIQELKAELDAAKERIAALEAA